MPKVELSRQAIIGLVAALVVLVAAMGWFIFIRKPGAAPPTPEQLTQQQRMQRARQNPREAVPPDYVRQYLQGNRGGNTPAAPSADYMRMMQQRGYQGRGQ